MRAMRAAFKPEFLNRIDDVIVFDTLDEAEMEAIARLQTESLRRKLADRGLSLVLDDDALRELARRGFDPVYGARPLKRTIQRELQDPLALQILQGEFKDGDTALVDFDGETLTFTRAPQAEPVAA